MCILDINKIFEVQQTVEFIGKSFQTYASVERQDKLTNNSALHRMTEINT